MNITTKTILISLSLSAIAGCSSDNHDDLKSWMNQERVAAHGRIQPLPEAKTFIPVEFVSKSDPFKEKPMLSLDSVEKNKYAPDPNRRKEPLESFPIENLKMVGSLNRDNINYAMIKTPDGAISYVKVGNFMGSNYGQVKEISEGSIVLDERVHDSDDEWKPKKTVISLTEDNK